MKRSLPTLELKAPIVSAIIPKPQRDKQTGHQHAVGNGENRQLQHSRVLADLSVPASARTRTGHKKARRISGALEFGSKSYQLLVSPSTLAASAEAAAGLAAFLPLDFLPLDFL